MVPPKKKKPAAKRSRPQKGKAAKLVLKRGGPQKRKAPARPKAPKKPKRQRPPRDLNPVVENPEALALAREAALAIVEKKGQEVVLLDVRGKASYADYIVIASADSDRGLASLAEGIEARLKPQGHHPVSREGTDGGQWLLLDYADVVVHLFHLDVRGFYDLEGLWADAARITVS